ncbi:MAG: amidohydrolase/deacetylase family metallohydrolase [Acidobacteriota bacterium]
MNRRTFLHAAAGFPAILATRGSLLAAEYDLVVRGGRVIDPAQRIDRIVDVAIRGRKIATLSSKIPASAAAETIDATGKLVLPGLIDVHLHARDAEMPPAEVLKTGVTTFLDGGSRGADNIDTLIEVARNAPNRMRILINIGRLGNNPGGRGEFLDGLEPADVEKAKAAIQKNRAWIVGMKARLSRGVAADRDLDVLKRAIQAAGAFQIPIMIHMGDTASPLPQILALLRPGDILTHLYAPTPHGIMDEHGKILPEVRAARKRGILFDFGNGLNEHWNWDVAISGLKQDFPPDTLSTDLTFAGRTEQVLDLPNVMSKFLLMGMPLNRVIACVTSNAARAVKELNPYGSLKPGSAADVTVLELAQGNFEFVDNYKNRRMGAQKLFTRAVVNGGKRVV